MKIHGTDPSSVAQFKKSPTNARLESSFKKFIEGQRIEGQKDVVVTEKDNLTEQQLRQAVDKLNNTMQVYNKELRFRIHDESGEMQVSLINTETDEVIRKIPPDYILEIVAYVKEALGLIVNEYI